jgi:hypothetical protein
MSIEKNLQSERVAEKIYIKLPFIFGRRVCDIGFVGRTPQSLIRKSMAQKKRREKIKENQD